MDPITQQTVLAAAGAGAGGDKVYVDDVFSTFLWEGDGGYNQSPAAATVTVNNGIDLSGEGGLVWLKNRDDAYNHWLFDTERGGANSLKTNLSSTQADGTSTNKDLVFNSTGFVIGEDDSGGGFNQRGRDHVSWTFRKAPGFFDVVTYNGQSNGGTFDTWITIPHNLGSTPGMVLVKCTSGNAENWIVWHRSLPTSTGYLNSTGVVDSSNYNTSFGHSSGAADANNVYVRAGQFATGYQGYTYVAYVFAHDDASFGTGGDESIIKCGTYEGLAYPSYRQINLGFEPQLVLIKNADASSNWIIRDSMRVGQALRPNGNDTEVDDNELLHIKSTGFEIRGGSTDYGVNNQTYIYMAIRRPNKPLDAFDPPLDATDVFAIDTVAGTSPTPPWLTSGFVTDLVLRKDVSTASSAMLFSRLQGPGYMRLPATSAAESTNTNYSWDFMNGFSKLTSTDSNTYGYMFKRAPGFMDVVAYSGTGSATTINHNLEVVPELMIVKDRTVGDHWQVYASTLGPTYFLQLNRDASGDTSSARWNNTAPTSSIFTVGSDTGTNYSGRNYIAYLFATLSGVSKIGSYTGTGNAFNVDCGFTAGARFVLFKRTDQTGNWYVFDTARGIVAGNDPMFELNGASTQDSSYDNLDPYAQGFTVTAYGASSPVLNISGATYTYLAIA